MYDYWHLKHKKSNWKATAAVVFVVVIVFFSGIIIGNSYSRTVVIEKTSPAKGTAVLAAPPLYDEMPSEGTFATIVIPAIDEDENGITTSMTVQAFPGTGRILTNIDKLLFWVDTQNSIRRATQVAENMTGLNLSEYDIIYTIQANASVIGGPSAGAAITAATIAALENRMINTTVMVTGSVNHDGTIGPVGGVLQKAGIAKDSGAELLLVPLTQSSEVAYKSREYCEKIGWVDFCTTETYPVKVNIEEETGIKVHEVMDISDVIEYMLV
ncbi:MAG: hypothetical protein JW789_03345 [Candidatus Aenigmarchaeota archaeon]|nr:hypothetical protein [Candidatus Aenigmarchaeota archaeon]